MSPNNITYANHNIFLETKTWACKRGYLSFIKRPLQQYLAFYPYDYGLWCFTGLSTQRENAFSWRGHARDSFQLEDHHWIIWSFHATEPIGEIFIALADTIDSDYQADIELFLHRQEDVCMGPRRLLGASFSTSICFSQKLNRKMLQPNIGRSTKSKYPSEMRIWVLHGAKNSDQSQCWQVKSKGNGERTKCAINNCGFVMNWRIRTFLFSLALLYMYWVSFLPLSFSPTILYKLWCF